MVLEVTAKTDKGTVVPIGKKEYWELGMDMDGYHRVGAWQDMHRMRCALLTGCFHSCPRPTTMKFLMPPREWTIDWEW